MYGVKTCYLHSEYGMGYYKGEYWVIRHVSRENRPVPGSE